MSETQALYDLAGDMTSLTYPSGRNVTFQYNSDMQPTQVRFNTYNGIQVGYNYLSGATYAPAGGPASLTLGSGVIESSTYNKRVQPCNLQAVTGTFTWLNRTNNFYPTPGTNCQPGSGGNNDNVWSIVDNLQSNRTQSFGYDSLNRITSAQTQGTSGPDCWGQTFGYDAWANLLSETATLSGCPMTQLSVGVNTQNQITNTGFHYDASGDLLTDGVNTYTYDGENRISTLNSTAATYTYDAEGQRVHKQSSSGGTDYIDFDGQTIAERNSSGVWTDYIFAGSRRLATATGSNEGSISNGSFEQGLTNWSTWGTAILETNATNAHSGTDYLQLTGSSTLTSGVTSQNVAVHAGDQITFGGWVNLQSGGGGGLGWALVVQDSNNNPIAYIGTTTPTSSGWTYQVVSYTVPSGAASVRVYAQVYQPSTSTTIWVDDGFLSTGTAYYHADHLGSARVMSDPAGNVMWSATYLPFGQEWNPQATVNHYKFTGKERDSESGLDNFGARYYSSQFGRFMSADPFTVTPGRVVDPQQLNLYAYVRNNPLRHIDPTGMIIDDAACLQDMKHCGNDWQKVQAIANQQDKSGNYLHPELHNILNTLQSDSRTFVLENSKLSPGTAGEFTITNFTANGQDFTRATLQLDFKQIKGISGVTASDLVPGFNKYQGLLNAPIDRLAETFGHEGAHGLFSIQNPAEATGIQQLLNQRDAAMQGQHYPYPPDVMQKINAAEQGLIPTERFAQQEEKIVNGELQADKKKQ